MRLEHSHTFRRARLTTIALATAVLIATADDTRDQQLDRSSLDVPYVPTPPEVVDRMMSLASVKPTDVVIDLGCGDGRIAIAAAHRGARALGIDLDPERVREAQDNARAARVQDRARFQCRNLFETSISEATVLTVYLLTRLNLDLRSRILDELKPGTRVVSHTFGMGDWKPDARSRIGRRQVLMWFVPAKAAGRWQVEAGAGTFELDLQQDFQRLTGNARIDGKPFDVRKGWLRGTEIRLMLRDGTQLDGRVEGDRMELRSNTAGKATSWHAVRASQPRHRNAA